MKVKILWESDRWDGPLCGLCEVEGEKLWFEMSMDRTIDHGADEYNQDRTFTLYRLTPEQLAWQERTHERFRKYVGEHCDYDSRGRKQRGLRPYSEHHKFYDNYDSDEFNLGGAEIVDAFSETDFTNR